ncbi:MAG: RimK family alpha-L-glutamate ligase [Candidatus Hermodarchaeota archaeon]
MILIIAPEDDIHALVVGEWIRKAGKEFYIWNSTWFPWKHRISWSSSETTLHVGNMTFDISKLSTIWWRRFRKPTVSPVITDTLVKQFCRSEATALIKSIVHKCTSVINNPEAELHADSKILQLERAEFLGLAIPKTLVSNNIEDIIDFIKTTGRTVCKNLGSDYPHGVFTKMCTVEDFKNDLTDGLTPTIIQELVPCEADVRVCIIGDNLFAGALKHSNSIKDVDWRIKPFGWKSHQLPHDLREKLIKLVRSFNLDTASIDLRLTPTGNYVFFEINPNGQFLFLEIETGLPISKTFAQYLIDHKKNN